MSRKQGFNPILPSWEYIPDMEPRVFGDVWTAVPSPGTTSAAPTAVWSS